MNAIFVEQKNDRFQLYVNSMIIDTYLPLPQENRPWPLSVYTLGRFAVFMHDKPLTFSRRVQKKPLELLRTLIAFGGRGVPIAKLAQALWPDKNSKAAKHALETTLYRLRKLLGDQCIEMYGGHLALNPDCCWVDVWSVERLLEPAAEAMSPMARALRLFDLYRGPFLDGDNTPSVLVQRDRLRSRFLRVIDQLGHVLESRTDDEAAIECYQRGIETDPLAEDLYRRLMQCYRKLGRSAEALAVYQRCHETLASVLSVAPAVQTTALYREIQED